MFSQSSELRSGNNDCDWQQKEKEKIWNVAWIILASAAFRSAATGLNNESDKLDFVAQFDISTEIICDNWSSMNFNHHEFMIMFLLWQWVCVNIISVEGGKSFDQNVGERWPGIIHHI